MEITNEWLKENGACSPAYALALKRDYTDAFTTIKNIVEHGKVDWANWVIVRLINRKQKIQYSVFAAELVLHIYEEQYSDDNRPRKAIEAAKNVINNIGNIGNQDAAASAASAASAAAAAASAASAASAAAASAAAASAASASAAYAAAYAYAAAASAASASAAYAAAYAYAAAASAASAASASAAYAAAYAAKKEIQIKIINYGLELLNIDVRL